MKRACIRAREQCRVSPRPCYTTYHHPGPEPIPVLSLSLSLFSFTTDRPTDLTQSTHPPTPQPGELIRLPRCRVKSRSISVSSSLSSSWSSQWWSSTFDPSTRWINLHWQVYIYLFPFVYTSFFYHFSTVQRYRSNACGDAFTRRIDLASAAIDFEPWSRDYGATNP